MNLSFTKMMMYLIIWFILFIQYKKVLNFISTAKSEGATILTGGSRPEVWLYDVCPVFIFLDLSSEMIEMSNFMAAFEKGILCWTNHHHWCDYLNANLERRSFWTCTLCENIQYRRRSYWTSKWHPVSGLFFWKLYISFTCKLHVNLYIDVNQCCVWIFISSIILIDA